jgi:hypothetical protein
MAVIVMNNKLLRLGILGISEGNGHPYSWSAIFNGYCKSTMDSCPFPVIPAYLGKQTFPDDAIKNAKVTYIWTQDTKISKHIAKACYIPHIVDDFEEMIGHVDAILLARDDSENHFSMSIPFIKAGIPIYIDKPICTSVDTLTKLFNYQQYPGQIFSCSGLRFAEELQLSALEMHALGNIISVEAETPKDWRKYGIHIVEPLLQLMAIPGEELEIKSVTCETAHVVIAEWNKIPIRFAALGNKKQQPICFRIRGEKKIVELVFSNPFAAFKKSLEAFIDGFTKQTPQISFQEMTGYVSVIERGMR